MVCVRCIGGRNAALMFCVTPMTAMSTSLNHDVDADFFLQPWSCPL